MKQNEKDLLVKDLCARLPYGVKFAYNKNIYTAKGLDLIVTDEGDWEYAVTAKGITPIEIDFIKPCLFPISSMTKEQKKEYAHILVYTSSVEMIQITGESTYDWLNKNMFDWRGLIPMGLAIDATNLNIY
jgi:hypothetical protein